VSRRLPTSPLALGFALLFAVALFGPLLAPGVQALGEHPYEWNQVINGTNNFVVSSGNPVAQSFVATADYLLLNLTLRLRNKGDTTDAITVTIRADVSGEPSASSLATADIVISNNLVGERAVPFPSPLVMAGGTRYWIVAESSSSSSNGYEWHHSAANAYENGKALITALLGGWADPLSPTDMYFVTYGREVEANLAAQIVPPTGPVRPGDVVTFRIFVNNTGSATAQVAWLNDTLLPGFTYISDTASAAGSSTPYPSYTFSDLPNGARSFDLVVQVDPLTEPGTVLSKAFTLTFTDSTGARRTAPDATANLTIGIETKSVYLHPDSVGPARRLNPGRPTGGGASQFNEELLRDGSLHDYDLEPVFARDFQVVGATTVLYVDSPDHDIRDLDVNLTLSDWNGVTLLPLAYVQQRITVNALNDFQPFAFAFPTVDHVFPFGGRIRLTIVNQGTSEDDLVLAINSTFAASRVDLQTWTYVRIDRIDLRDGIGPATVWSPKDAIVVQANVSDPFGSSEISGAWINITSPSGQLVVNYTAMALFATDPATPSVWKIFRFTLPPLLSQGTYETEVTAIEANGVMDIATASALVRAPSFSLSKTTTDSNVRGGDVYTYDIWYNNTGSGPAGRVWINDSLPGEVAFLNSSDPGSMTGNYNWTWTSLVPSNYRLSIDVQVRSGLPPIPYFRNFVFLNYTDEKGFLWPTKSAFADVALGGPVIGFTKTAATTLIHANETVVYQIAMQNTGDLARTLWVNDTLPDGITYVSHNFGSIPGGTATISDNLLYFEFANLPGLTTWAFTVTGMTEPNLLRGTTLTNIAVLNYTNSNGFLMPPRISTWTVQVSAPLIQTAAVSIQRNQATPADVITAVVTFANTGTESARDVWVNLTLDWGLLFLNSSHLPSVMGNRVHFTLANVPGGSRAIFLNASVLSNVTDHQLLAVAGSLTYTDGHRNLVGTTAISMDGVEVSVPKIILQITPDEATVEAGTRIFFNIYQANAGSGVAGDVWLTLQLPAGFSDARDASNISGATRTVVGLIYTWHWSNVGPGSKSFPLELTAKSSALQGTRANVSLHTDYTDANGAFRNGETASAFANFVAPRIILVLQTPEKVEARAGDTITVQLKVQNSGGATARNMWITYENESHFDVIDYSPKFGTARTENRLNWSFTDVQPGQERNVTLILRIRDGTPVRLELYPSFDAVYTNSADLVIGNAQASAKVVIVADLTPFIWTGIAAVGFGFLTLLAVVRRLRTQIEEVFLVYRDGVLLYHLSRSLSADKDEDVLSGMLTAVQEFVRDAFVYGEHRELHQLDFGDYRIMIERGLNLYLAVVYSGKGASAIRKRVRSVLDHIETAYGSVLEKWDGDMDKVVGARDLIREYLLKGNGRSFRGLPGFP
jgi:uncharacterized repeat protein (TIGR01451 family)